MNTKDLVAWINNLIQIDRIDKFYNSKYFKKIKKEVLKEQHYECQRCKEQGKLSIVKPTKKRSGVVHHVKEVRDYPQYALSKHYYEQGIKHKQLVVLCNECHEAVHDRFVASENKPQLNEEKW